MGDGGDFGIPRFLQHVEDGDAGKVEDVSLGFGERGAGGAFVV